jgi:hypothetical protein
MGIKKSHLTLDSFVPVPGTRGTRGTTLIAAQKNQATSFHPFLLTDMGYARHPLLGF